MPVASGSIAYLGAARFQGLYQASNNFGTGSGLSGGVTGAKQGLFSTGSSTGGGYAAATGLTASAGDYWQISVAGAHNIDGETTWRLNDWCIYSGSAGGLGTWKKLAFEDSIASIVVGDLSSSSFHMGTENDKHIIFNTGSVHSGSSNLVFDYTNSRVGINIAAPKTAFSVVHNYDSGSAGTKFEDQLSDNEGGGKILKYGAGTLTAGKLYYLGTDSNWAAARANAVATGASQLLGIAMGTSPTSNGLLLQGFFKVASTNIDGTATIGSPVYISDDGAGEFDFAAPDGSSEFVRIVGYCIDIDSSDILLYFNPDSTWVEIS